MPRKKGSAATVAPPPAEAPPATLDEARKRLIAQGKAAGSMTYEQINAMLEALDDVTPEQIEEIYEDLLGQGIEIVDDQKEEKSETEAEEDEEKIADGLSLDDPVRMYLKEIGRVPLLSMEEEKAFAMRIEAGEIELRKNGTADNAIIADGDEAKRQLTEEIGRASCRERV